MLLRQAAPATQSNSQHVLVLGARCLGFGHMPQLLAAINANKHLLRLAAAEHRQALRVIAVDCVLRLCRTVLELLRLVSRECCDIAWADGRLQQSTHSFQAPAATQALNVASVRHQNNMLINTC